MGVPKAAIELAGRPLISYPLEAVAAAGLEPMVVAKEDTELPDVSCRVLREDDPRPHPATGILAALEDVGGAVVVIACDMPFVPAQLLSVLGQLDAPIAVPMLDGAPQPLLARYGPGVIPALERAIERGEPLRATVSALEPLVLGPGELVGLGEPRRIAFNVNDRRDLAEAVRLMTPLPNR